MWVALISLLLGFYAAVTSVTSIRAADSYDIIVIYAFLVALPVYIVTYISIRRRLASTFFRFLYRRRHAVKRHRHVLSLSFSFYAFIVLSLLPYFVYGYILELKATGVIRLLWTLLHHVLHLPSSH